MHVCLGEREVGLECRGSATEAEAWRLCPRDSAPAELVQRVGSMININSCRLGLAGAISQHLHACMLCLVCMQARHGWMDGRMDGWTMDIRMCGCVDTWTHG